MLARVAAGDAAAPAECIDRFSGLVWSLARRLCSSAAEAEDAVQEIFIDVWKSAGRFDPAIASETTFVAMIARRRLIDRGRRRMRRPEVPQIAETLADAAPERNTSEMAEEFGVAQRAFAQLRPEQQQVLQLAIHHGCSHEQIATATGMPLGTVKTHARRGLIKIRQILADQGVLAPEDLPRDLPQSQTSRAPNTQDFPRIRDERASETRPQPSSSTSSSRRDLQP
ncbi:MAG: sigma-70 family RNA polymerase sigma factor [Phycisphaera sp.]|nr:sigma-70 family RNA polymerase sigma factor [Phycisphaera sp.]